jgi:hypothetical protein
VGHTATSLPDGTVLIAGGFLNNGYVGTALTELYNPFNGLFSDLVYMNAARGSHQATLLRDGRVLITGGVTPAKGNPNYEILSSAELYNPSVLVLPLIVGDLQFDRMNVTAGSSYSVNVSGSNLTVETFFDVRFTRPESNDSVVALNWQKGRSASHSVPAMTASGNWTITGVRAHEIETDNTGVFFPVSATITVSP